METWTVDGRVVLTGSLDQFGDSDLTAALGGLPLGRTPEQLQAELGKGGTIPLTVQVTLPDERRLGRRHQRRRRVVPRRVGPLAIRRCRARPVDDRLHAAASSGNDARPYLWFGLAAVAVLAAVSFWIFSRSRARSRR